MDNKETYLILGNGEEYIEPVQKSGGPPTKEYRFTYEQTRLKLKDNIRVIRESAQRISPDYRMNELVLCLRILPEFMAKSYYPQTITTLRGLKDIGSRSWNTTSSNKEGTDVLPTTSKLIFLRVGDEGLNRMEERLDAGQSMVTKAWTDDVRRIDSLTFLSEDESILGFPDDWSEGRVELVLHPFSECTLESIVKLKTLLERCGVSPESINAKPYAGGPTFISVKMERSILSEVAQFNPLRTAHPMEFNTFPTVRTIGNIIGPSAPKISSKSTIIPSLATYITNASRDKGWRTACSIVSVLQPVLC